MIAKTTRVITPVVMKKTFFLLRVMLRCSSRMLLIRKREPDKTSASELIESHQGFSVAIPVLQVKREIHIRKLLPEFEFAGIFAVITEYRRFYIQLMVP